MVASESFFGIYDQNSLHALKSGERAVDRAEAEVGSHRYAPIVPEPSASEEIECIRSVTLNILPPTHGVMRNAWPSVIVLSSSRSWADNRHQGAVPGQFREHEPEDAANYS